MWRDIRLSGRVLVRPLSPPLSTCRPRTRVLYVCVAGTVQEAEFSAFFMNDRSISFLDDPNAAVEFAGLFLGHQLGRTMPYSGPFGACMGPWAVQLGDALARLVRLPRSRAMPGQHCLGCPPVPQRRSLSHRRGHHRPAASQERGIRRLGLVAQRFRGAL